MPMTRPDNWPSQDHPGENTSLRLADAPAWLQEAFGDGERLAQAPDFPRHTEEGATIPEAAVLICISGDGPDTAEVLLTHRNPGMRSHAGQIAFPGGRVDATDTGIVDTALREAWEETGLDRTDLIPLLSTPAVLTGTGSHLVHPVVAYWANKGTVGVASPQETDDVFTVRITELADPEHRLTVGWDAWHGPAFLTHGYVVWGFTAAILDTLLQVTGWAKQWDAGDIQELSEVLGNSRNDEI